MINLLSLLIGMNHCSNINSRLAQGFPDVNWLQGNLIFYILLQVFFIIIITENSETVMETHARWMGYLFLYDFFPRDKDPSE